MRLLSLSLILLAGAAPADEGPDPAKPGPFAVGILHMEIPVKGAKLTAVLTYPARKPGIARDPAQGGPFPVILLSPGGDAPAGSVKSYADGFGARFASHGFVACTAAFNGDSPWERAGRFGEILDWLEKRNADKAWRLAGALDLKRIVASGHSRGGLAALIASSRDPRFTHCLAMNASHHQAYATRPPEAPANHQGRAGVSTLYLTGDDAREDGLSPDRAAADDHWRRTEKPRALVQVSGMNHGLQPLSTLAHAYTAMTAWLLWQVKGDARCKPWIAGAGAEAAKKRGEIREALCEEVEPAPTGEAIPAPPPAASGPP